MTDPKIRADIARFARALDRKSLIVAAPKLREFDGPVRLVWGTDDRCFTLESGRRLAAAFGDAQVIEVPDVSTFVSIDAPKAVADAIASVATADQST